MSVTKGFHVFKTYLNSWLFVCSNCTIQSHITNLQPFPTSFAIFHAFTNFFELNAPEIEKHYKWTLKRVKVGMVPSFHPHSMCKKVERVTEKKDALREKTDNLFRSIRVCGRKLVCCKGISFFKTYLNSWLFVCSKCTIQSHIINFQPFLTSFVIFHAFTDFFEL